jgi:hypothetical protein
MPLRGKRTIVGNQSLGGLAMRSILDPLFRYTSSYQTDIRKTFARVRSETRWDARSSRSDIFDRTIPPVQRKRGARS